MITVRRGDTKKYKFIRHDKQGNIIKVLPSEMYITFKKNTVTDEVLFQKRLDDNSIEYNPETYYYSFTINPEDTQYLSYTTYPFDIEIVEETYTKTIYIDRLNIIEEVTFGINH